MKIDVVKADLLDSKAEAVAVGVFNDLKLNERLEIIDRILNSEISNILKGKKFSGDIGQLYGISTLGKLPYGRLILVGLGDKTKFDLEAMKKAAAYAALAAKNSNVKILGSDLHNVKGVHFGNEGLVRASAEGFYLSMYEFSEFKTQELEKIKRLDTILILEEDDKAVSRVAAAVKEVEVVTNSVYMARDLVNRPPSSKMPKEIARYAEHVAKTTGIKIKVYDKADLEKMGMNAILAINRGSAEEPRLVVMDYNPEAEDSIALVGKGITFDSGGLNIKPFEGMRDMKQDMAGAATVIATVAAASILKLPLRVIGIAALTENMPGPNAIKCGDIVKTYNGKTIEILNTDAEGRVVLSDALAFAEKMKPKAIIDLATLTGAVNVALGRYYTGALGNNEELMKKVKKAGEHSGEKVWELPLTDEYMEMVKGDLADVRNIGKLPGEAGVMSGAAFLKNFIESTPWVHLDIAGTAFLADADTLRPYLQKGATGVGVRMLIELLKNWK